VISGCSALSAASSSLIPHPSEGRAGLLQELLFRRGGFPSQDGVAVGKAPEARDDVAVALGVVVEAVVFLAPGRGDRARETVEAPHAQPLQLDVFRVLQREVEERALGGDQPGGKDAPATHRPFENLNALLKRKP